jgi:Protein of unknwon function (DUF3310)
LSARDIQVGGTHYREMKIQPVEFIQDNLMGFCEGSVVKYVCRWRAKNGLEDLRKAKHYLQLIAEAPNYIRLLGDVRRAVVISVRRDVSGMTANEFIEANGIENPEAGVIRHVWLWNAFGRSAELSAALKWIQEAIELANGDA